MALVCVTLLNPAADSLQDPKPETCKHEINLPEPYAATTSHQGQPSSTLRSALHDYDEDDMAPR